MKTNIIIIGVLFLFVIVFSGCAQQKTKEVIDSPLPTQQTTNASQNIVEITSEGFVPNTLKIKQGETVTWINRDSVKHRPASAIHPTHEAYPGSSISKCGTSQESQAFDACKSLSRGESYSFTFNEIGTWKYHDHLKPGRTGTIVVE